MSSDSLQPIYSRESEEAVLGSVLINPDCKRELNLAKGDFYIQRNGWIWEAMNKLQEQGSPIDYLTLCTELERINKLDEVGGASYITSLLNQVPSSLNADAYSRTIQEKKRYREYVNLGNNLVSGAYNGISIEELDNLVISETLRSRSTKGEITDCSEHSIQLMDMMARDDLTVFSGISKIDRATAGFWRAYLIIFCARPSVGKTALTLQLARLIAMKKHKVHYYSLEMSGRSLVARMACGLCEVDYRDVVGNRLKEPDKDRLYDAIGNLNKALSGRLFIMDTATTTAQIWQKVNHDRPDIIFIDHLRCLKDTHGENENKRQGYITQALKEIAKEFNIPVVCAAQLNRNIESRQDKIPTLADLRDSGEIEENADLIVGMSAPNPDPKENIIDIDLGILKFRDGPPDFMTMEFDRRRQWFDSRGIGDRRRLTRLEGR
jgi:replicative DNA helicase